VSNKKYFADLGYKYASSQHKFIVKDFQRHAGISADGVIGPVTKGKMAEYGHSNYCPTVFEPIKPYIIYSNIEIESLMEHKLTGLGATFNINARINDFDVLHSIAHAILESNWGTSAIASRKNNLYGFGAYDLSPMVSAKKFTSFAECIQLWSEWVNENYLEPWGQYYHGNCEKGVNYKYASSGIAGINKAFIVENLRKQIGK